jgi:hypothetical protein
LGRGRRSGAGGAGGEGGGGGTHAVMQLVEAEVADSISDGFIIIFLWNNPSGRTMALEPDEPLTEMSTRNIPWGRKAAGA